MVGDNDFIKQSHTNSLFSSIPNAYLSIIPAASHYAIKERPKIVNATLIDFLSNSYSKPKKY
jgi:pimeloyl-ACP methyl ester carboxylesterase